jgi:hypothetical protein
MKKIVLFLIVSLYVNNGIYAQEPYAFLLVNTPDNATISVNGMSKIIVKSSSPVTRIPVEKGDNLVEIIAISPPARAYSVVLNFSEPSNKFFKVDFKTGSLNAQSAFSDNSREQVQNDVVKEDLSPYQKSVQNLGVNQESRTVLDTENLGSDKAKIEADEYIEEQMNKKTNKLALMAGLTVGVILAGVGLLISLSY